MTSVAASAIAIILGIAVFIILAYKGLSPILASLVAALIIGCTCEGGPLTAIFSTFMGQAVNFMSSVLLLIVIGGLLSAVLETTGPLTPWPTASSACWEKNPFPLWCLS